MLCKRNSVLQHVKRQGHQISRSNLMGIEAISYFNAGEFDYNKDFKFYKK